MGVKYLDHELWVYYYILHVEKNSTHSLVQQAILVRIGLRVKDVNNQF